MIPLRRKARGFFFYPVFLFCLPNRVAELLRSFVLYTSLLVLFPQVTLFHIYIMVSQGTEETDKRMNAHIPNNQ